MKKHKLCNSTVALDQRMGRSAEADASAFHMFTRVTANTHNNIDGREFVSKYWLQSCQRIRCLQNRIQIVIATTTVAAPNGAPSRISKTAVNNPSRSSSAAVCSLPPSKAPMWLTSDRDRQSQTILHECMKIKITLNECIKGPGHPT